MLFEFADSIADKSGGFGNRFHCGDDNTKTDCSFSSGDSDTTERGVSFFSGLSGILLYVAEIVGHFIEDFPSIILGSQQYPSFYGIKHLPPTNSASLLL